MNALCLRPSDRCRQLALFVVRYVPACRRHSALSLAILPPNPALLLRCSPTLHVRRPRPRFKCSTHCASLPLIRRLPWWAESTSWVARSPAPWRWLPKSSAAIRCSRQCKAAFARLADAPVYADWPAAHAHHVGSPTAARADAGPRRGDRGHWRGRILRRLLRDDLDRGSRTAFAAVGGPRISEPLCALPAPIAARSLHHELCLSHGDRRRACYLLLARRGRRADGTIGRAGALSSRATQLGRSGQVEALLSPSVWGDADQVSRHPPTRCSSKVRSCSSTRSTSRLTANWIPASGTSAGAAST